MRKRVKIIMFIVAAAFIAGFLLSEVWQLIRSHERDTRRAAPPGVIAQVGEQKVGVDEYRQVREFIAQKYRQDSLFRDLTNEDEVRIEHATWNYLVQELTWSKIFKEAKLAITDGELEWIITRFPPPELQNRPEFLTDGKFDTTKYLQALQNPQNRPFFARYARQLYEELRPQKLQMYVAGAFLPNENEVQEALALANTTVSVTAVYIGPGSLTEEERKAEPTEAEIRAYYEKHRHEYQPKEEIRELRFVFFPLSVTSADSQAARQRIEEAYRRLLAADSTSFRDSFEMAALMFGDYEPETASVAFTGAQFFPATESVVRRLKPGRFSPPLQAENGWQIVLLDSVKKDTFWVRRIRTRIKPDDTREIAVLDRIKEFVDRASGSDFDSAAAALGLSVAPTPARVVGKKKLHWAVEIYNPGQLVEWASSAKKGEILDIPLRGRYGFYIFQLSKITPAKPASLEQVKDVIRWRVKQEKEKEIWRQRAATVAAVLKNQGTKMEEYAAANPGVELIQEEVRGMYDYMVRGRRGAEFVGAALALEPGQTAGPIETRWGCYIIRCDDKRPSEQPAITAEKYLEQQQQQIFNELWQKLTEEPETRDWRAMRGY